MSLEFKNEALFEFAWHVCKVAYQQPDGCFDLIDIRNMAALILRGCRNAKRKLNNSNLLERSEHA